ncbi:MAG: DEAD/DEAH box helicase [Candidatus Micrarchaeota archaeon]|nr:DEAD/DEAH box helicase [Candidatus Micrarchaeota archaeon]
MSEVYEAFLEEFKQFTNVQERAIRVVESGDNCIITAATGSGKTEAALLPVLSNIVKDSRRQGVSALYVTPLRALNRDLLKRLRKLCSKFGVRVEVRHGDTTQSERTKQSKNPPDILITTPETIQSIFLTGNLRNSMRNLKAVIVDELHELYYNKRGAQFSVALERLVELAGEFQRIGISATVGDIDTAAYFLCAQRPCSVVDARGNKEFVISIVMPRNLEKEYAEFSEKFGLDKQALARIEYMADRIRGSQATLLFANTRQVVESLGNKLIHFDGVADFGGIGVHHGSLDKEERIGTENAFKEGKIRSIIATSSLELGIDIGNIDLVIQYGSPRQVTRLVQRVGRAGHSEKRASHGDIVVASVMDALESAAIVSLNKVGMLEKREIQENALDVLVNQLSSVALEYKKLDPEFFYNMIKRSSCYAKLERKSFEEALAFASEQRLIRNGKEMTTASRTRRYVIEKISVIPDSTRFVVKNISTNKIISSLDENFVYNNIEEGTTFVTKGLVWRVVSIDEKVIFVEPSVEIDAAIPDWEGEDIPVSHAVASTAFSFFGKHRLEDLKSLLSPGAYSAVLATIEEQEKHFPIDEDAIHIEETDERAIIYVPLGKLANDFFGKIISALVSASVGRKVLTKSTPYAIILEYEGAGKPADMKKVLEAFKQYKLENLLQSSEFVSSFDLFRYKFVQNAKLFGVIERKATITRSTALKLIGFYRDSQIFEETVRDLVRNYFDIESVRELQRKLIDKQTKVFVYKSFGSAIANEVLRSAYFYRELMNPLAPSSEEIDQFAQGLMSKSAELICTYCGFRFKRKLSEIKEHERIRCVSCRSPMVAVYEEGYEQGIERRKNSERFMKKSEVALYAEAIANASLVEAYGLRALIALATYGVGNKTAARILKWLRKDTKLFLIDLINAQKQFIKNKKYWADR